MPSFVLTTVSTTAQTVGADEFGLISSSCVLTTQNGPAITLTGQASVTVLGTVLTNSPFSATGAAIEISGPANRVVIGEGGFLGGIGGAGLLGTNASTFFLDNSGQISGGSAGVWINGDATSQTFIVNSGKISADVGAAIIASGNAVRIFNTGEILSATRDGIVVETDFFTLRNAGMLTSISFDFAALTTSDIINTGVILGRASLGLGNDVFDSALGTILGVVSGYAGDDWLTTGAGDDELYGGANNDTLDGGAGDDILFGDEGQDTIMGGQGSDTINGGTSRDLVDYRQSWAGIELDLRSGEGFGGDAEGDQVTGVESVRGTAFADTIIGDKLANSLRGGAGADRLVGGDDTLRGGLGSEGDTFYFAPADGNDIIADLEVGRDVIDLTAFGFTTLSQILDNAEVTENLVDILIDFNNINIASRILLQGLGGMDILDLEQSLLFSQPI